MNKDERGLRINIREKGKGIGRLILSLLPILILSSNLCAQSRNVPISALVPPAFQDEPVESDDPGHKFTLTYGFNKTFHSRSDDVTSTVARGPFSFSIDVAPWLTLVLGNDTFKSVKPQGADRITGFGNTSITAISGLVPEETCAGTVNNTGCKQHPSFTLIYYASLPTASKSKGLGSGRVDHSLIGAIGKTIGDNFIEVDFGAYLAGRSDRSGFINIPLLNLIYERSLGKEGRFIFHSEVDGTAPTDAFASEVLTLNYLTYKVNDSVALRVGMQNGITANSPKFGFYASITYTGFIH